MSLHDKDPCGIMVQVLKRGKMRISALERWHDQPGEESYMDLTPSQAKQVAMTLLGQAGISGLIVSPWHKEAVEWGDGKPGVPMPLDDEG